MRHIKWSAGIPSLSWIFSFTCKIVSLGSTSNFVVFPVNVFTKIGMPLWRTGLRTKYSVDSFWMLYLLKVYWSSNFLPAKMRCCRSAGIPSLSWIFSFKSKIVSLGLTSNFVVFPVDVFTKIGISPRGLSSKCSVDSFWMLYLLKVHWSSNSLPAKKRRCRSGENSSFSWIFIFTFSIVSYGSVSKEITPPVSFL